MILLAPIPIKSHVNLTHIFQIFRSRIPESDRNFSSFLSNPNLNPVTLEEISKFILTISPNKMSGPGSIPTRILKLICGENSVPLADIFNLSFELGQFPSSLNSQRLFLFNVFDQFKVFNILFIHQYLSHVLPSDLHNLHFQKS